MKKNLIILTILFLIVILICIAAINLNKKSTRIAIQKNKEYEKYLNNEIFGTDIITLINKATSSNEENNVVKDEKGFYIDNNYNSIKIDIVMITDEEKQENTTYKMEAISKIGISEFIKNFNTVKFKCTNIQYHKETGKIKYIQIEQKQWS